MHRFIFSVNDREAAIRPSSAKCGHIDSIRGNANTRRGVAKVPIEITTVATVVERARVFSVLSITRIPPYLIALWLSYRTWFQFFASSNSCCTVGTSPLPDKAVTRGTEPQASRPLTLDRMAWRRNRPIRPRFPCGRAIIGSAGTPTINWELDRLSGITGWISGPSRRTSTRKRVSALSLAHSSRITSVTNTCSVQSVLESVRPFARPSISNGKIGPGYLWKQLPNLMSDRFCAVVSVYKQGFEVHRGFLAVGPPMETITSSPKLFTGFSQIWRHEAGSAKASRIYAALVCQFHFGRTGASPRVTSPRPN